MKYKLSVATGLTLLVLFFTVSCAGAPKPTPQPEPAPVTEVPKVEPTVEPKVEAPVVEPVKIPEPTAEKDAAVLARTEAAAYDSEALFPSDWKVAQDSFDKGDAAWGTDNEVSRVSFETSAKAFKDVTLKAKPVFLEMLGAAKLRADQKRREAFQLEAQTYFPADWKKADAGYVGGREKNQKADAGDWSVYPATMTAYKDAGSAFEALAASALPRFASDRKAELVKARADAVSTGAPGLSPNRFAIAESDAQNASRLYDSADYYLAYDAWNLARNRYIVLATGARAYAVKAEIDRRNLAAWDSGNYGKAVEVSLKGLSYYDSGKVDAAGDAADEAFLRFKLALAKGRELYAGDRGKSADVKRREALDLKANVAVKADFEAATKILDEANKNYKAERYDEAAEQYVTAENRFEIVRLTAAEKRKRAEEAMEEARLQIIESERTAREADAVLEGGAK